MNIKKIIIDGALWVLQVFVMSIIFLLSIRILMWVLF